VRQGRVRRGAAGRRGRHADEGRSVRDEAAAGRCRLEVVYFDFNEASLSDEARTSLDRSAQCLRTQGKASVVVEGHADERGTEEYNIVLGEKRATAVRRYLAGLGWRTARSPR